MKSIIFPVILYFCLSSSVSARLIQGVDIGPSVKLIDIPHPVSIGLESRVLDGLIGLSVHKGFLPKIKVDDFDVKLDNLDFGVKLHPWKGSFYVGVLVGTQKVAVSTQEEISGEMVDVNGVVKGSYLTPHLGWQWRWNSGLFLGMSLGWQISSGAKTSIKTSHDSNPLITGTEEFKELRNDIIQTGNDLGNKALPNIGLLQLGWMF